MSATLAPPQLTLYGRTYCHLCTDMEAALEPLRQEFGFVIEVVDVDTDPELEARYGELVPVLAHGDTRLCHYFLDEPAVRRHLVALAAEAAAVRGAS
ncbi:MAG TPA: glutaredoxin family protein [Burkholderiales bacterium]|nr:glutaredoxin family protein [Burkholderiales bacterium]